MMKGLLASLNLIDPKHIEVFHPCCRDSRDIEVLRCPLSRIIFLSDSIDRGENYYKTKDTSNITPLNKNEHSCLVQNSYMKCPPLDDVSRYLKDFGKYVSNQKWLDFGTGYGEVLLKLGPCASRSYGLEPNDMERNYLIRRGLQVYKNLEEVPKETFDVITLFHVFEHLSDPIQILKNIREKLNENGFVIIEVPHARDFLIETLDCEAFKNFTFWSEHLILHTRQSLEVFIRSAGFKKISIKGYQRYPFFNHLYWLRHGKPGGHQKWAHLNNEFLEKEYRNFLQKIDQTDTLIAFAWK